jgi:hypothetical protein
MQQIRRYLGDIALGLVAGGYAQATDYTVVFNSSNSYEIRHDKINSGLFTDSKRRVAAIDMDRVA